MEYGRKRLEPERNILQCAGDVAFTVTTSLVYSKLRYSYTGEEKGSRLETLALHTCEVFCLSHLMAMASTASRCLPRRPHGANSSELGM